MEKYTRNVTGHQTHANTSLIIRADVPDDKNGNASHNYVIESTERHTEGLRTGSPISQAHVNFQHGPIAENGVNGVTNEALLAIVADRLRGFQSSPYSCRENALALTKVEEALLWLHYRTSARESRGVEGTSQV